MLAYNLCIVLFMFIVLLMLLLVSWLSDLLLWKLLKPLRLSTESFCAFW